MGDFNMPPGVRVSDIPGNRPEEEFWEKLDDILRTKHPKTAEFVTKFWDEYESELIVIAEVARNLGYEVGFDNGRRTDV